jgi:hypothetical protein
MISRDLHFDRHERLGSNHAVAPGQVTPAVRDLGNWPDGASTGLCGVLDQTPRRREPAGSLAELTPRRSACWADARRSELCYPCWSKEMCPTTHIWNVGTIQRGGYVRNQAGEENRILDVGLVEHPQAHWTVPCSVCFKKSHSITPSHAPSHYALRG